MGATPVPSAEIARFAREFETSGWDGLAFGEAHALLPDPYGVLADAATATTTLRVRTALAAPFRHPSVAADAMATIPGISGGRARFTSAETTAQSRSSSRSPCPSPALRRP
jgi:alkanesulfonate monooxygenase SsuD/methylene tetrahydromethanopterin reductase-like flavin-dependent oxidoreductase (luciferase family)